MTILTRIWGFIKRAPEIAKTLVATVGALLTALSGLQQSLHITLIPVAWQPYITFVLLVLTAIATYNVPNAVPVAVKRRRPTGVTLRPLSTESLSFTDAAYYDTAKIVVPTGPVGHRHYISKWGMLLNNLLGCCVPAGLLHFFMLATKIGGRPVTFSNSDVRKLYEAVSPYRPNVPNSDQGTDPAKALSHMQKVGVVDKKGVVHKIEAYATIPVGDFDALRVALSLDLGVGICLNLPDSAQQQFPKEWTYVPGSPLDGGHWVDATWSSGDGITELVSWGASVDADDEFMTKCGARWYVYPTKDTLVNGLSATGLNIAQLVADGKALAKVA